MSLVETTKNARIFLKIGGAAAIFALFIFLVFKGGQFIQSTFFPEPPPAADQKFGELPLLEFPPSSVPIPKFTIETISGFLPTFPLTIQVYELVANEPTITALPDARIRAESAGFKENEQAVSDSEYKWTRPEFNSSLLYDIYSLNFSVLTDYTNLPNTARLGSPQKTQINNAYTSLITTLGGNLTDINPENAAYSYYTLSPEGITPTQDPDNAVLTRVDLFQNPVNKLKIYYPIPNSSLLFFVLTSSAFGPQVVEANYSHFIPNLSKFGTYNLKTAQEALEDLKNGNGYIAQPTTDSTVGINEVELGYYLSESSDQKYLQPIIVFKGANKFQAYVSALKN